LLVFHVKPWRVLGQDIQSSELCITKPMPRDQIAFFRQAILATSVLSFSIHDLSPTERGTYTATLEILNANTISEDDPEMAAAAEKLRQPVEIKTAYFGILKLDRRVNLFEGEVEYAGRRVWFSVPARTDSTEIEGDALTLAESVWPAIQSFDQKARQLASAQLLELKNDNWLGDDEDDLTDSQFQTRIALHAVYVSGDGEIMFYYDDGGIFCGHSIDVSGTVDGGFTGASI
jgi:hypothetical protein